MAASIMRTSFGYNKTTPTSSPRSSPPSTLSSGKSRLPVYSRSNSSTPHRPISGPTTATRVNLTPIFNRRTPSPHPSPDDSPQVKVIYGRVEDKPPTPPTESSPETSITAGSLKEHVTVEHEHSTDHAMQADESPIRKRSSLDSSAWSSKSQIVTNTTITLTPCSPTKSVGKAHTCNDRKISLDSITFATSNAYGQVNFSHPGRAKGGRNSTGSIGTHSTTPSTSTESENTTMPSSAAPSTKSGFPPRTTSRQDLVELLAELPADEVHTVKSPEMSMDSDLPSSFKLEHDTMIGNNDNGYRTVRLSLRPDSAQSILGPTMRVSEDAEGLLRGPDSRPIAGRLRMPSFGTTSSDESTIARKAVSSAHSALKPSAHQDLNSDENDVVGRRAFSEKRVLDDRSSSMTSVLRQSHKRHDPSTTPEGSQDKPQDNIKTTAITTKNSILRDRRPSPHTALLFNRALTSGSEDMNKPSTSKSLVKSKTSPNLGRAPSSPGTPPVPPPKDTPNARKSTEDRIRSLSPSKHLPRRAMKSPPPPPPEMVITGLRPPKQRAQKVSISRPSAFVESWSSPIPSHDFRGFDPVNQFSASFHSRSQIPAPPPVQSHVVRPEGSLGTHQEITERKKLPRSTSRPRLIASNLRNLFQRRSNDETTPSDTKTSALSATNYTPTTSPASTQLTWTPTMTSPTKLNPTSRLKARVHLTSPATSQRPPTRGKPLISPAQEKKHTDDEVLTCGTNLAMHLTKLASSAASGQNDGEGAILSKETALALASTLVTTITATRDAEVASIAASAKSDEAKVAYEGARNGVVECVKLVEKCLI